MAQPVWVLSVDLQTKTATFQSGLSDAAKAARGSFNEIKSGADGMGKSVSYSMMEARHSVMMIGEEFGVHLPRALTSFIASLGPVGAAMEAAFPFLAIALGATLLLEHLSKLHEEGEKLTDAQGKFAIATQNAFNQLDQKLLEAGIRTDELNGNHLATLKKQLELIDHQSMADLVRSFDEVAKAADVVFGELKSHWYTMGIGSEGAKHALDDFKRQYDLLLAQGKDSEASGLLSGTLKQAQKVLELQKQAKDNLALIEGQGGTRPDEAMKYEQAKTALKQYGVGFTEKEVQAQQTLVDALKAQVDIEGKVAALKHIQQGNATTSTGKEMGAERDKQLKADYEAQKREQEEEDRLREENYRRAVAQLEQGEREKIEATERASAERLAAIDSAIAKEHAYGLDETNFYRSLLLQRIETVRQMTAEENKIKEEAGKLAAEHTLKMAELDIAAAREQAVFKMSVHRMTADQIAQQEIEFANREYAAKMATYAKEEAALDKTSKDYDNKLRAIQNKELELIRQHENQITQIKDRAATEQAQKQQQALARMENGLAQSFLSVLGRHQSLASMMQSISQNIVTSLVSQAIAEKNGLEATKLDEAKAAARKMYLAGTHFPWPTNIVMAPMLGAMGFAAMMAFEGGTDRVPGVGKGDIVPAMLTPGEGVVPGGVMDRLRKMASSGGDFSGGGDVHVHYRPTYHVKAIDGASVRGMLQQHSEEFSRHVESHLRKMNR